MYRENVNYSLAVQNDPHVFSRMVACPLPLHLIIIGKANLEASPHVALINNNWSRNSSTVVAAKAC